MTMRKIFLVLTLGVFLSGCAGGGSYYDAYDYYEDDYEESQDYGGTGITRDNWECTEDCGGHEAGYEWAEENGIEDPYDCDGNSNSFIEGCEAYANEQLEEQYEEEYYEDSYDDYYDYGY